MSRGAPKHLLIAVLLGACPAPYDSDAQVTGERRAASNRVSEANEPMFVAAAALGIDDVPAAVIAASRDARIGGHRIIVYVGASWCEPCRHFHDAVDRGELGARLAGVRFLEFDADHDTERLEAAGYGGQLIPRFVVPGADGRGSGLKIEGGIKGDGAVEHIMQRLMPLLARSADAPPPE